MPAKSAGMSALVLYTMSISQTPAFQKPESRWGCHTKQDYSVSQVISKIATSSLNIYDQLTPYISKFSYKFRFKTLKNNI